jgi:hypothetical protein
MSAESDKEQVARIKGGRPAGSWYVLLATSHLLTEVSP